MSFFLNIYKVVLVIPGMDKRGISGPVAMVIMILMVVAAVGIVWTVALPMVREGVGEEKLDAGISIETEGGYTYFDEEAGVACVQVRRSANQGELIGLDVLFSFGGESYEGRFESDNIPGLNEASQKCFDLTDFTDGKVAPFNAPDSVEIAPVFLDGSREIVGAKTSSVDNLRKGSRSDASRLSDRAQPVFDKISEEDDCVAGEVWDGESCVVGSCASDGDCDDGNECTVDNCESDNTCSSVDKIGDVCSSGYCYGGSCNSWIPVLKCETLDIANAEYKLMTSLSSLSDGCFVIDASGITFDLDSKDVSGSEGNAIAIRAGGVSILNAGITDSGNGGSGGITGFSNGIYIFDEAVGTSIQNVRSCGNTYNVYCASLGSATGTGNNFVHEDGDGHLQSCSSSSSSSSGWPILNSDYTSCKVRSCGDGTCDTGEECAADCSSETDTPYGCTDGVDNDYDDFTTYFDCQDSDCQYATFPNGDPICGIQNDGRCDYGEQGSDCSSETDTPYGCTDGVDNEGDGLVDCDDLTDCEYDSYCL